MKIHNVEQGTDEWFILRLGKLTASKADAIAANGKGLDTLCLEKVSEILTYGKGTEQYSNEHTDRGNELESEAIAVYELLYDCKVDKVGFCELNESVGCSPDGLVGDDALVEIKCPSNKVYTELLINKKIPSKYNWQCQMQMLVTGRVKCDLAFYNPHFENIMQVFTIEKDQECFDRINAGLNKGTKQIKEWLQKAKGE